MKKMTRLAAFALALCMIIALAACAGKAEPAPDPGKTPAENETPATELDRIKSAGKIIMLTNAAFPPFEYLGDDNKPAGVDVDVASEIAKDLGVTLEVVDMDFDGLISALASGKGDFIAAGMSVTPERAESVDFSVEYVTSSQYIIVPEGSTIATLEDLKGKKIGVQLGTTGDLIISDEINGTEDDNGAHVTGALEGSGATVSQYKTGLEAALDLKAGRLDAVVIDKDPAKAIVANNEGLKVSDEAMSEEEKYAIAVKKDNTELLDAINGTLNRLIDEGKIEEFLITHTN